MVSRNLHRLLRDCCDLDWQNISNTGERTVTKFKKVSTTILNTENTTKFTNQTGLNLVELLGPNTLLKTHLRYRQTRCDMVQDVGCRYLTLPNWCRVSVLRPIIPYSVDIWQHQMTSENARWRYPQSFQQTWTANSNFLSITTAYWARNRYNSRSYCDSTVTLV